MSNTPENPKDTRIPQEADASSSQANTGRIGAIDSRSNLTSSLHRYLTARGWEQRRFFDGDTYWADPLAHHDHRDDDTVYPAFLALAIQWYRDNLRRFRVLRRSSPGTDR